MTLNSDTNGKKVFQVFKSGTHTLTCQRHKIREAFQRAAEKLEIEILEMDGEADHFHVLIAYLPKLSISVLVNNLKLISSRRVRILNTNLRKVSDSGVLWSRSYFACCTGGAIIETLKAYVASQKTPD
ncbi:IS1004 transposase [Klebsiella oxytoca]|jgi:putative transposase|uniref:Transposase n=1 Tax=Klebsiella pneumoniae TaxID=573 RepID=A0A6G6ANP4_KLEPN|nr:Putative transposase [Klebsiella pneumoniae]UFD97016.1 Putative transposase [Klebsiella pneumoniae]SAQ03324.1 IS1004 transposase [Klebsiella oxytoca]VTM90944.1 Transposase and inactivated derivatives [Raoultella ornithinolytica]